MNRIEKRTYIKAFVNIITFCLVIIVCVWLLPKAIIFFLPFLIGWIISLMAAPIVKALEKKIKIKRKMGSAFVIVLVLALVILAVYGIGYFLVRQVIGFVEDFPELWESAVYEINAAGNNLRGIVDKLPEDFQRSIYQMVDAVSDYFSNLTAGEGQSGAITALGNIVNGIPEIIMGIVMVLLSSYFFVAEKEYLSQIDDRFVPAVIRYRLNMLRKSFAKAFGGYFKAQLKIEVWVYIILVIGLLILRVKYAFFIALGIAFMDFLPVFGAGTIMIPWALIKFIDGDFKVGIGLIIVWGIGQLVRQIIQPKIVGDSMGMPPIPTLFLLYIGFETGGFLGMIVAVPIGIIIVSLYEEGVFNTTLDSIKILVAGFNRFRKISDREREIVEEYNRKIESDTNEQ